MVLKAGSVHSEKESVLQGLFSWLLMVVNLLRVLVVFMFMIIVQ